KSPTPSTACCSTSSRPWTQGAGRGAIPSHWRNPRCCRARCFRGHHIRGADMRRTGTPLAVVALAAPSMLFAVPSIAAEDAAHWSYAGETGPDKWGTLEKEFSACGVGKAQAPIDIRDDAVKTTELPAIRFDYRPSTLRIIDNGHSIQVNYAPG